MQKNIIEKMLLSQNEMPYKIPDNWVWVSSEHILDFVGGGTPSKSNDQYWNGDIPWATVKDVKKKYLSFTKDYITSEGMKNSSTTLALENELLLVTRMSPGKSTITKIQTTINQDLKIVKPKVDMTSYFLWLFFTLNAPAIEFMSTGSTVKGIQVAKLKKIPFPLPPMNEQKRIVNKVEYLFNKIDEAQKIIEEVKKTFEIRLSSIIKNILEEGLNDDVLPIGWERVKLKDLFKIFGGGTPSKIKSEYWNGKIPWISAKDMKTMYISKTMDNITELGLKNSSAKLAEKGSIALVVRSGILKRTLPVAYLLEECTVNQDLKIFDSGNELINKYFMWYIKGNEKDILNKYSKSGTTVNSLEFESFKSHELILPPMSVLREKVIKIEKAIGKENDANKSLITAEPLTLLKHSIIAKAFKGELGTNDLNDENAKEILKELIQK